jgi:hypothetical protein
MNSAIDGSLVLSCKMFMESNKVSHWHTVINRLVYVITHQSRIEVKQLNNTDL